MLGRHLDEDADGVGFQDDVEDALRGGGGAGIGVPVPESQEQGVELLVGEVGEDLVDFGGAADARCCVDVCGVGGVVGLVVGGGLRRTADDFFKEGEETTGVVEL